jgi:hypothetical protein
MGGAGRGEMIEYSEKKKGEEERNECEKRVGE